MAKALPAFLQVPRASMADTSMTPLWPPCLLASSQRSPKTPRPQAVISVLDISEVWGLHGDGEVSCHGNTNFGFSVKHFPS